jgi:peptidoglycan/LPS O-acetylase OafA/YrhL
VTSQQTSRPSVTDPVRSRRAARALVLDVVAVLVFVAVGRRSHGETDALTGVGVTAWPFLAGLAAGWAAFLALRLDPESAKAGAVATVGTVVVGMLLRHVVAGEGTAVTFVVVATGFLALFLLGRRVLVARVARALTR